MRTMVLSEAETLLAFDWTPKHKLGIVGVSLELDPALISMLEFRAPTEVEI